MIRITDLIKTFGPTTAVSIGELTIRAGEITGIAGNNGAGKTTLLRLMLDLLKPDTGMVCSKDRNVYQSEHWKSYTGAYIDEHFLIGFLKPLEYFELIASLYGINATALQQMLDSLSDFLGSAMEDRQKLIRQLSSGNRHKLGIAGALIPEPEILILDEPFNFLDPGAQSKLKDILKNLCVRKGTCIILSSHNLYHIAGLCNRILLMEKGKIIEDMANSKPSLRLLESYFELQGSN